MAEARITEFFGETQIRVQVLDFMGLGSCMPREAWRLPSPQTLHNYYSGYIKMYAEYAAPMTTMLKGNREETKKGSKKALVWTAESDRAFEGMKQALLSAVGLHLVDPDRGFVLRTDASD